VGVGGLNLHHEAWFSPLRPRAAVVLLHGIGNHGGSFAGLAETLAGEGYAVHALDQRGHGRSQGPRASIEHFADLIEDVRSFIEAVRAADPDRRLFLLGHSWGGLLALAYAVRWQHQIDGLVLCAAGLAPSSATAEQIAAVRQLARVAPDTPAVELRLDKLTRDPEALAALLADPLMHRDKIPARLAVETLDTIAEVSGRLETITLPVLLMHGTGDQISDPAGTRLIYDQISSTDRTLKLYEGLWHQLFNEPEQAAVIADLAGWLGAHE
jgi:alpha-beta hydrolase superfamily lysophospholipase